MLWRFPAATHLLLLLGTSAHAEQIGATLKVVNQVTAEYNRDTRTLIQGDGVNQDEVIAVGSDALSELLFKDETKLALGPGSQMKLDKFVYDPAQSNGSIVVNLFKGGFRFITGVASKPTYVIRTPSASITVRGTIFDVYVFPNGSTWLLLHEGAVAISNGRGACKLLDSPGRMMRVTADGSVGIPVNWADMPNGGTLFDTAFPFVVAPPSMDPNPVYTRTAILAMPPADANRSLDCGQKQEDPIKQSPRRADDDNDKPQKKAVRRAAKEDDEPVRKPVKKADDDVKPKAKNQSKADVGDEPVYKPKKKKSKDDADDDKPDYKPKKPSKVVVYEKPDKPKRPKKNYDGEKVAKGVGLAIIGIAAGIAISKGGHKGGGDYGGHKGGGYGGE